MTLGIVVIGRNEGERLRACLASVMRSVGQVVYVDSGSSDNSLQMTRALGVEVVELNMRLPFTAARARNEGFRKLRELVSDLTYVQFVDGDCALADSWMDQAILFLRNNENVAVACGRLRERYPERSIYNLLCDIEWDTPVGETKACGGIAMMRVAAFEHVNGFRDDLIAGEEPELCVRLRALGWRVWRMDEEMAIHDAAILHFSQWWKRSMRGGFAFAQGVSLHGAPPERHYVRESCSIWFWGLGVPVGVIGLTLWMGPWALILFLIYLVQIGRLAARGGHGAAENWWRAGFLVLGKFPEMFGQMKFLFHRHLGGQSRLIEYK